MTSPETPSNLEKLHESVKDLSRQALNLTRYMVWPGENNGIECQKLVHTAFTFEGDDSPISWSVLTAIDVDVLTNLRNLLTSETGFEERVDTIDNLTNKADFISSAEYKNATKTVELSKKSHSGV
jgi:hypothetical protein